MLYLFIRGTNYLPFTIAECYIDSLDVMYCPIFRLELVFYDYLFPFHVIHLFHPPFFWIEYLKCAIKHRIIVSAKY